jgi:hypothetical protein
MRTVCCAEKYTVDSIRDEKVLPHHHRVYIDGGNRLIKNSFCLLTNKYEIAGTRVDNLRTNCGTK